MYSIYRHPKLCPCMPTCRENLICVDAMVINSLVALHEIMLTPSPIFGQQRMQDLGDSNSIPIISCNPFMIFILLELGCLLIDGC